MIQLKVIDSVHDGEKTFEDSATKCFRFVGEPNRQLNLFSGVNAPPTNHFAEMLPPERYSVFMCTHLLTFCLPLSFVQRTALTCITLKWYFSTKNIVSVKCSV